MPHIDDRGLTRLLTASSLDELVERLTRTLGIVVGGSALSKALGYRTQGAFRQALTRNRIPIPVFALDGRRGRFALTSDIAQWLWSQRTSHLLEHPSNPKIGK